MRGNGDHGAYKRGIEAKMACPRCGAKVGEPCVVTRTHRTKPGNVGRKTQWPHAARVTRDGRG